MTLKYYYYNTEWITGNPSITVGEFMTARKQEAEKEGFIEDRNKEVPEKIGRPTLEQIDFNK